MFFYISDIGQVEPFKIFSQIKTRMWYTLRLICHLFNFLIFTTSFVLSIKIHDEIFAVVINF